jgi:hypothetical protein
MTSVCQSDSKRAEYLLTELEAFDAMIVFLTALWERGERSNLDIRTVLSFISRDTWEDRSPADPAQWEDWLSAVAAVKQRNSN